MAAARKFLFETEFGDRKPEPVPSIPLAEHEAALVLAEARGAERGRAEATAAGIAEAERRVEQGLARIEQGLARLAAALPRIEARLEAEAVDVAVAVARKLAAELVAREPVGAIGTLVASCLGELRGVPHVVVRVHDSLLDSAKARIDSIAAETGFSGRVVMIAEPDIAPGDARIEWADGGLVRDTASAADKIDELVRRFLAARAGNAFPGDGP